MENDEPQKSTTKDVIDSVTGLVNAVPIYQDAIQPTAKVIGKSLETVAKTVDLALEPVRGLVWGYDKVKNFIEITVSDKLKDTPEEKIITPDATIAGPLIESLKYTGHKEELQEMYANLLATAMHKDNESNAHPSFVDIIKNMNSDEAKIIKYLSNNTSLPMISINVEYNDGEKQGNYTLKKYLSFVDIQSGCKNLDLISSYYENLLRLKLIDIPKGTYLTATGIYDKLENRDDVVKLLSEVNNSEHSKAKIDKTLIQLTEFGKLFTNACV